MHGNIHVLIAEDDIAFRRVIDFMLRREGMTTITAGNGAEALEKLKTERCNLLITDAQMPTMNGIELIEHVRTHSLLMDLPIILCTAKGFEIDSEQMKRKYNLTAIFHKPFSPIALVNTVRSHAELAQKRTNNSQS